MTSGRTTARISVSNSLEYRQNEMYSSDPAAHCTERKRSIETKTQSALKICIHSALYTYILEAYIAIERHRAVLIERSRSVVWKFYIHNDNGVNSEVVGFVILCYGYTRGGLKSIFEYHRHRIIMYNTTYSRGCVVLVSLQWN